MQLHVVEELRSCFLAVAMQHFLLKTASTPFLHCDSQQRWINTFKPPGPSFLPHLSFPIVYLSLARENFLLLWAQVIQLGRPPKFYLNK